MRMTYATGGQITETLGCDAAYQYSEGRKVSLHIAGFSRSYSGREGLMSVEDFVLGV